MQLKTSYSCPTLTKTGPGFQNFPGVKTWFDAHDILPGERWAERVQQALRDSKILIVILSPDSVDSPWTFFEIGAAVADDKRIIPIFIKDVDPERSPLLLRRIQYLKEPSASEAGRRVAQALKEVSSQPSATA